MTDNSNQNRNQGDQSNQNNSRNSNSNGDQQNRPIGAKKMDESLDKPEPNNLGPGDSSRYANTSDNEDYNKRK